MDWVEEKLRENARIKRKIEKRNENMIYAENSTFYKVNQANIDKLKQQAINKEENEEILRQKLILLDSLGTSNYILERERLDLISIKEKKDILAFEAVERVFDYKEVR